MASTGFTWLSLGVCVRRAVLDLQARAACRSTSAQAAPPAPAAPATPARQPRHPHRHLSHPRRSCHPRRQRHPRPHATDSAHGRQPRAASFTLVVIRVHVRVLPTRCRRHLAVSAAPRCPRPAAAPRLLRAAATARGRCQLVLLVALVLRVYDCPQLFGARAAAASPISHAAGRRQFARLFLRGIHGQRARRQLELVGCDVVAASSTTLSRSSAHVSPDPSTSHPPSCTTSRSASCRCTSARARATGHLCPGAPYRLPRRCPSPAPSRSAALAPRSSSPAALRSAQTVKCVDVHLIESARHSVISVSLQRRDVPVHSPGISRRPR